MSQRHSPREKKITLGGREEKTGERLNVKMNAANRLCQRYCALKFLPDLVVEQVRVATNT